MKTRDILIWVGFIALIIVSVLGIIFLTGKSEKSSSVTIGKLKPVSESDWIKGNINAKVIIIEYSNFECPACAAYHPVLKQLEEKFGSQIGIVYRHFPLREIHKNAEIAAIAVEAAGRQGKFWEMHDLLSENQKEWSKHSNPKEIFVSYARQLNLNEEQFLKDLNSKELKEKVIADYQEAIALGLKGTPSFFLNGKKIPNPRTYEEFEKLIIENLNQ